MADMAKMKDTTTKGKGNRSGGGGSTALAKGTDLTREQQNAAIAALQARGYEAVVDVAEGEIQETGVVEKETLLGVPFVVIAFDERKGDYTDDETGDYSTYFFVQVMLEDNTVVGFSDGGAGIREQLRDAVIDLKDPRTLIKCPGGLKVAKYISKKTNKPAQTWRLAKHPPRAEGTPAGAPAINSRTRGAHVA